MADITADQIWKELEDNIFAVLGMVTANNQARTVGVVYVVRDHKLYIITDKHAYKVRHVAQNPDVSLTVPIAKRIFFMPWIKIPAATITLNGIAKIRTLDEIDPDILSALLRGLENNKEMRESSCVIEVQPQGDCITYGVGVSLMEMRDTVKARGRVRLGKK